MDERQKNYELIDELFNELKGLLANYPNNRVDFESDFENVEDDEFEDDVFEDEL